MPAQCRVAALAAAERCSLSSKLGTHGRLEHSPYALSPSGFSTDVASASWALSSAATQAPPGDASSTQTAAASAQSRGAVERALLLNPRRLPMTLPHNRAAQTCVAAERARGHALQDRGLQSLGTPSAQHALSVRPRSHAAPRHVMVDSADAAGACPVATYYPGTNDLSGGASGCVAQACDRGRGRAAGALRSASRNANAAAGRIQADMLRARGAQASRGAGSHIWGGLHSGARGVGVLGEHATLRAVTARTFSARERPDVPMAKQPVSQ